MSFENQMLNDREKEQDIVASNEDHYGVKTTEEINALQTMNAEDIAKLYDFESLSRMNDLSLEVDEQLEVEYCLDTQNIQRKIKEVRDLLDDDIII